MKRIVMCLLLGIWTVAIAQAPPGEEQAAGADAEEQVQPCVAASDVPQAPAGESGPLEGQPIIDGQASVPCEELETDAALDQEQDPGATPGEEQLAAAVPGEIEADPEFLEEEDPEFEATADEEFDPDDEISEDYPVPLPSDI
jgi:hypothetical protein